MRDPTDLIANAEADRKQSAVTRKQRQDVEDLKWLLAHRPGRRIAWKWMADGGVFAPVFNHSGSVMAFNEGRRNLSLQLLTSIMEHAPDAFTLMQKEAKADDDRSDERRDNDH